MVEQTRFPKTFLSEFLRKSKTNPLLDQIQQEKERAIQKLESLKLTSKTTNIKLKLPNGSHQIKKFPSNLTVEIIFDWAKSLDFPDCILSSIHPRIKLNDFLTKSDSIGQLLGASCQILLEKISEESSSEEEDSEDESE